MCGGGGETEPHLLYVALRSDFGQIEKNVWLCGHWRMKVNLIISRLEYFIIRHFSFSHISNLVCHCFSFYMTFNIFPPKLEIVFICFPFGFFQNLFIFLCPFLSFLSPTSSRLWQKDLHWWLMHRPMWLWWLYLQTTSLDILHNPFHSTFCFSSS